ncbi:MAG: carbon monoxide dehydrogenase subunit G [Gammaproteobacteria bacterium]
MKINGQHELDLDKKTVWDGLNNIAILEDCIPGCEKLEEIDKNNFNITVLAKVGPIKTRFNGTAELADIQPPDSYKLVFSGNGGSAGSAKGETLVTLTESGGRTILNYESSVAVTGKLAQIGAKLIDGAAKSYANQFFEAFVEKACSKPDGEAIPAREDRATKAFSVGSLINMKTRITITVIVLIILIAAGLIIYM